VDDVKGNDHMFSAQLIDAKDSKLSGKGHYIRTGVGSGDLSRVSLTLAKQLEGQGRRHVAAAPARSYPVELDIEMVFVEGGTFTMGCVPERDGTCNPTSENTFPHSVTVSSFSIGKYEVTRSQWVAVMEGHPLANSGYWRHEDQMPIECVGWLDIDTAFLPRLNSLTGKNYRLPSEAEWDYAARGCKGSGSSETATCESYIYSGSNDMKEIGWISANSASMTHAVGGKKPNGLGIYDMSGNVWEYCKDKFSSTYYKTSPTNDPENTPAANDFTSTRVIRGGGWNAGGSILYREGLTPNSRVHNQIGFRVVLPAQ
jgi:formylglycine-generating enzyme required for sulfatase activity